MSNPAYNVVQYHADTSGCGHYRMLFPAWAAQTLRRDVHIVSSSKMIAQPNFYSDIRTVRLQRQVGNAQCAFVTNFLKPLSEQIGFWLAYEVDDVIGMEDIPRYNSGWKTYQDIQLMENVKNVLKTVDILTVTTKTLGKYYVKKFGIDRSKVVVIPNFVPRWWIGAIYDEDKIKQRRKQLEGLDRRKPRIVFASSTTHFDTTGECNGEDDFSGVVDFVRSTVNQYDWTFIGGCPIKLEDLARDKKILIGRGADILNYPHQFSGMNFDAVIAPLRDNIFNRCKSNIKHTEMSAMGIPCLCQDLEPYQEHSQLLFKDANQIQIHLDSLFSSENFYIDTVKHGRDFVEGNSKNPSGWWLETNMEKWMELYSIPQKTLKFDLRKIKKDNEQKRSDIVDLRD